MLALAACTKSPSAPGQRADAHVAATDVAHTPTPVVSPSAPDASAAQAATVYPDVRGTWTTRFNTPSGEAVPVTITLRQNLEGDTSDPVLAHCDSPGQCVVGSTNAGGHLYGAFPRDGGLSLVGGHDHRTTRTGFVFDFGADGRSFTGFWTNALPTTPGAHRVADWAGERTGQAATTAAPPSGSCIYPSHSVFHLRSAPVGSTAGAEEITTRPRIEVLRSTTIRRGREAMYYVHFLDGTDRRGWMYIPVFELAECAPASMPVIATDGSEPLPGAADVPVHPTSTSGDPAEPSTAPPATSEPPASAAALIDVRGIWTTDFAFTDGTSFPLQLELMQNLPGRQHLPSSMARTFRLPQCSSVPGRCVSGIYHFSNGDGGWGNLDGIIGDDGGFLGTWRDLHGLSGGAILTFAPDGRTFTGVFTDRPVTTPGGQRRGTWNGRRQGRQTRYQR